MAKTTLSQYTFLFYTIMRFVVLRKVQLDKYICVVQRTYQSWDFQLWVFL